MKETEHIRLNENKWDKWAPVADGRGWKYDYLRKGQNHVLRLANLKKDVNFLDISCGTGWAVGHVAKMIKHESKFYGVDISVKMIEKAAENYDDIDEKISTVGTNNEGGTGLGLVLCKEFVELNHGIISVESSIDVRSNFTVELPYS